MLLNLVGSFFCLIVINCSGVNKKIERTRNGEEKSRSLRFALQAQWLSGSGKVAFLQSSKGSGTWNG